MLKKTNSSALPKKSAATRSGRVKGTRLGRSLVKGLTEVLAHVRGEVELGSYTLPYPVNVKEIRQRTGLSQVDFSRRFSLNARTVQQWEQGKAMPDVAVRAYLTVIDRNPAAVIEALRA
ncbi:MAG: helix-turn-helix domain-containing protein [Acidobacteriia bacterium]|nr:helix-turn-helix domain-containing protein [Terriglobia bacterium]